MAKKFGNIHGNTWNGTAGLGNQVNDNTRADEELSAKTFVASQNVTGASKESWAMGWANVTAATLGDHHPYRYSTAK